MPPGTQALRLAGYLAKAAMDLLERQTQLEELARHLREAGTSAGKIVFVSGEAGAGKSVLVEQFAQQTARAARVLWGHCDALQTSRVLGPVNEVVAALSARYGSDRTQSGKCCWAEIPLSPSLVAPARNPHQPPLLRGAEHARRPRPRGRRRATKEDTR